MSNVRWVVVEGTTWPVDYYDEDTESLSWQFRYRPESVSQTDLMAAASILDAYAWLTGGPYPRDALRRSRKARKEAFTAREEA